MSLRDYEFPSAQLELVSEDNAAAVTTNYVLINRVPEDGETQVPFVTAGTSTPIVMQIIALDGSVPDPAVLTVRVGSTTVFFHGSNLAGYTSELDSIDSHTLQLSVYGPAPFASGQHVRVQVSTIANGVIGIWTFVMKDITPPQLLSAEAQDTRTVRLTFNEPMTPETTLVPANYILTRENTFAVTTPVSHLVVAAATDHSYTVDVVFPVPLTFGATYRITTLGVTDIYGNVIAAPTNTLTFVAQNPTVPDGRRFVLWDFIPEKNKREDTTRDLYKVVSVYQEITNVLLFEIDRMATIIDPNLAPEAFVDVMLEDLGNPFQIELSLGDKRKLLSILLEIYHLKGTTPGLRYVAQFLLGVTVTVVLSNADGWVLGVSLLEDTTVLGPEYRYQLYTFDLTVDRTLSEVELAHLIEFTEFMKPPHTHLGRILAPGGVSYPVLTRAPYETT